MRGNYYFHTGIVYSVFCLQGYVVNLRFLNQVSEVVPCKLLIVHGKYNMYSTCRSTCENTCTVYNVFTVNCVLFVNGGGCRGACAFTSSLNHFHDSCIMSSLRNWASCVQIHSVHGIRDHSTRCEGKLIIYLVLLGALNT